MHHKIRVPPRKSSPSIVRVKHGSAVVPIYQGQVRGCPRYTQVFNLNGQRTRHTFGSLQKAKAEAQLVAQRVQERLSSSKDMNISQRQCYLTLERMITPVNIPWLRPLPWPQVGRPPKLHSAG